MKRSPIRNFRGIVPTLKVNEMTESAAESINETNEAPVASAAEEQTKPRVVQLEEAVQKLREALLKKREAFKQWKDDGLANVRAYREKVEAVLDEASGLEQYWSGNTAASEAKLRLRESVMWLGQFLKEMSKVEYDDTRELFTKISIDAMEKELEAAKAAAKETAATEPANSDTAVSAPE